MEKDEFWLGIFIVIVVVFTIFCGVYSYLNPVTDQSLTITCDVFQVEDTYDTICIESAF